MICGSCTRKYYVLRYNIQEIEVICKSCTRNTTFYKTIYKIFGVICKSCTRKYYILQDNIQDIWSDIRTTKKFYIHIISCHLYARKYGVVQYAG